MTGGVIPLEVAVDPREVRRYLGYGRKRPSERVERRLEEIWSEAAALVRPVGAWRLVGRDGAALLRLSRGGRGDRRRRLMVAEAARLGHGSLPEV